MRRPRCQVKIKVEVEALEGSEYDHEGQFARDLKQYLDDRLDNPSVSVHVQVLKRSTDRDPMSWARVTSTGRMRRTRS